MDANAVFSFQCVAHFRRKYFHFLVGACYCLWLLQCNWWQNSEFTYWVVNFEYRMCDEFDVHISSYDRVLWYEPQLSGQLQGVEDVHCPWWYLCSHAHCVHLYRLPLQTDDGDFGVMISGIFSNLKCSNILYSENGHKTCVSDWWCRIHSAIRHVILW